MEKLIIKPKEAKAKATAITITIRLERSLQEKYDELSAKTNRSRSELINIAMQYALDNMEIQIEE